MDVFTLDTENMTDYVYFLTPDIAENIGRTYYRGIVVEEGDGEPVAAMVWEVRNVLSGGPKESNIIFFRLDEEDAADLLFDRYKEEIAKDEVALSRYSLRAKALLKEKTALKTAGFSQKLMEGDTIRTKLIDISRLSFLQKNKAGDSVQSLCYMTQRGLNTGIKRFVNKGKFGICEDIAYLQRSYFDNDVSTYSEEDGMVNGLFLVHKMPSGGIKVLMMGAFGTNASKDMVRMIIKALEKALPVYPPETEVLIDRHNYAALAISEKLFPTGFGYPVFMGERKEG